ncbi:MAG: CbiX/SirB N-terminal domain-containing protein [Cyanobacteriota bacterium]|nr:CbiX/SirB N-terminal domain-containing protein [Cyanobacteriota bacterium]
MPAHRAAVAVAMVGRPPDVAPLDLDPAPLWLPPPGSPDRWPWLQELRRRPQVPLGPWLDALERGKTAPETDLLTCLLPHATGADLARLLAWWVGQPDPVPALPGLPGPWRDPLVAQMLRQLLDQPLPPDRQAALLPLLGHQRHPADGIRLCRLAVEPGARAVRAGALEALSLGLTAWPRQALRACLERLVTDLDPQLAAPAVDLLDRLPAARLSLVPLARRPLDPGVAARLQRRLDRRGADPLLLVVHGRAGGLVPAELNQLAVELEQRRGAPVGLQALTAEQPARPPARRPGRPLGLVPLLLLPGGHVRHDIPALAARLRHNGPVRCWPFVGAWPGWQRALAAELAGLAPSGEAPLLWHHPLEGRLPGRYLSHLARCTAALPRAAAAEAIPEQLAAQAPTATHVPLALAHSRLCEALAAHHASPAGDPLLARPVLRAALLNLLDSLP